RRSATSAASVPGLRGGPTGSPVRTITPELAHRCTDTWRLSPAHTYIQAMIITDLDGLIGPAGLDLLARASDLVPPEPLVIDLTEAPAPQDPVKIDAAGATLRRAATMTALMGRPESCPASLPQFFDLCLTDIPDPARPWVSATPDQVA